MPLSRRAADVTRRRQTCRTCALPQLLERGYYLGGEQFHLFDVVVDRIEQELLRPCPDQRSQFVDAFGAAAVD